jgi:hypothetical protein
MKIFRKIAISILRHSILNSDKEDKEDKEYYSVLDFENRYNISGFSESYIYPEGFLANEFSLAAYLDFLASNNPHLRILLQLNNVNDELVRLNPQLGMVRRDKGNFGDEMDFMFGTVYMFPPRDINFFINVHKRLSNKEKPRTFVGFRKAVDRLDQVTQQKEGWRGGWVTSPETIALMHAAADRLAEHSMFLRPLDQNPNQGRLNTAEPYSPDRSHGVRPRISHDRRPS